MRFPNRIYGEDAAPYTYHNEQRFPMGQVMELPNGRLFRYARAGAAASVANTLCQAEVVDTQFDTLTVATGASVGGTGLIVTNGTTTIYENEFAEGTLVVESVAGLGHIYPIKTSSAAGSGGAITIVFMDGVTAQSVISAGTHKVAIAKNPWADYIVTPAGPSAQTAIIVGVPTIVAPQYASQWICSHGVASVLIDSDTTVIVIGQVCRASESDSGAVAWHDFDEADDANAGYIGWVMQVAADEDFGHIFLTID